MKKWRKPEVMLPIRRRRTIRFRGGPGALARFSFHQSGESPRCCPVLCGLRDRCIAAMLATQSGSQWSCSTTRVIAGPTGYQPAAVRLSALTSMKLAAPDGFAPSTSRVRIGRSAYLSYRAKRSSGRRRPGMISFTRGVHFSALPRRNWKWRSREDSHLEPPPSQGGVQDSYTSGAWKTCVMPVPPRRCVFGRDACSLLHQ